jgi:hypothetical protein
VKRDGSYVALWGIFLTVLAWLQFAFAARRLQWALALGVALVILVLAALLLVRPNRDRVRLLPQTSYATVLLAVGVVMVALGLIFGQWLYLMGAGVVVLGAAGVAREVLAARRTVE